MPQITFFSILKRLGQDVRINLVRRGLSINIIPKSRKICCTIENISFQFSILYLCWITRYVTTTNKVIQRLSSNIPPITVVFWTLKDRSLLFNIFAPNECLATGTSSYMGSTLRLFDQMLKNLSCSDYPIMTHFCNLVA